MTRPRPVDLLQTASQGRLQSLVRTMLKQPQAAVLNARIRPLGFTVINSLTAGLYRCHGNAMVDAQRIPFSCVVKHLRKPSGEAASPAHWLYWKRELLAYQSDFLQNLPPPFRAPRCFGVTSASSQEVFLWMEEVPDAAPPTWSMERVREAANHLGTFNGRTQTPAKHAPRWMSRNLLLGMMETNWRHAVDAVRSPETWSDARLRRAFPVSVAMRLLHLYNHRGALFAALDHLPKAICHLDAYRPNLLRDAEGSTVAVDWAFVGVAPLGVEPGQLVAGNLGWLLHQPQQMGEFFENVCGGYVDGLRATRWRGQVAKIRASIALSAALRVAAFFPYLLQCVLDRSRHRWWKAQFKASIDETLEPWGDVTASLLDLGLAGKRTLGVN